MTGKRGTFRKLVVGAAVAVGLAGGIATAPAALSAPSDAVQAVDGQPRACGFWVNSRAWAFYTHCTGSVYTVVQVKIDTRRGPGSYICVRPGTVGLGPSSAIRNAYYTGRLC